MPQFHFISVIKYAAKRLVFIYVFRTVTAERNTLRAHRKCLFIIWLESGSVCVLGKVMQCAKNKIHRPPLSFPILFIVFIGCTHTAGFISDEYDIKTAIG